MHEGPDIIALADQATAAGKQLARVVVAYFDALVALGMDRTEALVLTASYQETLQAVSEQEREDE